MPRRRCSLAKACAASSSLRQSGGPRRSMPPRSTSPTCALAGRIAGYRSSRCNRCSLAGRSFNSSRAIASAQALLDHLREVVDFAAAVGATALVFGSPKNRVRGAPIGRRGDARRARRLSPRRAQARDRGVVFCIEANPAAYGCDFITTNVRGRRALQTDGRFIDPRERGSRRDDPGGRRSVERDRSGCAVHRTRSRQRATSRPTVDGRRARACRVGAIAGGILGMGLNRDARSGPGRSVGGAGARDSVHQTSLLDSRRLTGAARRQCRDELRVATRLAKRISTAPT